MASIIETLAIKLVGDVADFEDKLNSANKQADSFGDKMQKVGGKMTDVGKGLTLGVTLPIVGMGLKAIESASDLNETMSKVDVVFGKNAASVQEWAKHSATAFGQSRQQALDAAGTYGALFNAMGIGSQKSTQMSESLVQLAGDLASFNNMDPTVVLDKLRSGLTGETMPLKTLGVNINEAAIRAKAMELGLAGAKDELTAGVKAQATYALILEQTKQAQGDFSRTSDGLANSTRIAKAELADATAQLGQQLLPYAVQAVHWISQLIDRFTNLSPQTQKWILIAAGIAAAVGPALTIIGTLITVIGALSLPILAVIAAVGLLAAAWYNNWGGIREKTQIALTAIQGYWTKHSTEVKAIATDYWDVLKRTASIYMTGITGIVTAGNQAIHGDFTGAGATLKSTFTSIWTDLKGIWKDGLDQIKNFFALFGWKDVGESITQGIADGIKAGWHWVTDAASGAAQAALDAAKGLLGIHSPSKVAAQELGRPFAQGFAQGAQFEFGGMTDQLNAGMNAMIGGFSAPRAATAGAGVGAITIEQHFYGAADAPAVRSAAKDGVLAGLRQRGIK